jgi:PAS domain-containing protein
MNPVIFSFQILVTNDMACELFNYGRTELIGARLTQLLHLKNKDQEALTETHLEEKTGTVLSVSGKVASFRFFANWVSASSNEEPAKLSRAVGLRRSLYFLRLFSVNS